MDFGPIQLTHKSFCRDSSKYFWESPDNIFYAFANKFPLPPGIRQLTGALAPPQTVEDTPELSRC